MSYDRHGARVQASESSRVRNARERLRRLRDNPVSRPPDLRVPVGALSAGQRRRLALARLVTAQPDLLLLDEPSNHLSLTLVEELEEAMDAYASAAASPATSWR
jgi:macrolide transport system ATP-binding/permease protein